MIRLFVEALFALIFAQALVAYLRRRDPVERDVMAVFTAAAMLFALDLLPVRRRAPAGVAGRRAGPAHRPSRT